MSESPTLRVDNAERANAVSQLEQQAALGRLSADELTQRTSKAHAAVYDVDLDALFHDIPGGRQPLPTTAWDTVPNGPSGVSDNPYPHQEMVAATPAGVAENPRPDYRDQRREAKADYREQRREARADYRQQRRDLKHQAKANRQASPLWYLIPALYSLFGIGFTFMPWQAALAGILMTTFIVTPIVYATTRRQRTHQELES